MKTKLLLIFLSALLILAPEAHAKKKKKKTISIQGEVDMRGPNGLLKVCKENIDTFCKAENSTEASALTKTYKKKKKKKPPTLKLALKVDVYSCLLNHVSELEASCKDKVTNSSAGRRLAVKKACVEEINSQCQPELSTETEAPTTGNPTSAGSVMMCLVAKKSGITNTACVTALESYMVWLQGRKSWNGQVNMNALNNNQNSNAVNVDTSKVPQDAKPAN